MYSYVISAPEKCDTFEMNENEQTNIHARINFLNAELICCHEQRISNNNKCEPNHRQRIYKRCFYYY